MGRFFDLFFRYALYAEKSCGSFFWEVSAGLSCAIALACEGLFFDIRVMQEVILVTDTFVIEGLNRQFRKITKNKPSFTNDDSLRKMLYLASQNIVNHWTVVCRNWDMVSNQLRILFEDRETV